MTNTRIVFFSILIAILLAILVMWCADILAHNDGNPIAHFEPYTEKVGAVSITRRGKRDLVGRAGDSGKVDYKNRKLVYSL